MKIRFVLPILAVAAVLLLSGTQESQAASLFKGMFAKHSSCCEPSCCEPAPVCCEPAPTCCEPDPCCDPCDPCCKKKHRLRDLLHKLFHHRKCCDPCCEPEPCCEAAPSCCG